MPKPKQKEQPCPMCGGTMIHEVRADELAYEGHTTTIRSKGWWCTSCGEGILEANALKASERAFRDLKAKVECLRSWESSRPDEATVLGVQSDLNRMGATCKVSVKREYRGQWQTAFNDVATFAAALELVPELLATSFEVAILLRHESRGGVFIWTSLDPGVPNRFEDW